MADFAKIDKKWQNKWEAQEAFVVSEDKKKDKSVVIEMFPYPSGDGLHIGHALNYTIGDIRARFKRMQGKNVLYAMGYDALGLPAENAAIKAGTHPKDYTKKSISNFIKQQKMLGLSYDWSRMVNTSDPDYYKWDQWIFLQMLDRGLAYQKESAVNWCPKCNSVLANEQVHNGKCWRHEDCEVEIKHLKQWFLKITDYAEELLSEVGDLDWPSRIKTMQKNWIGKSYGTEINFEIIPPGMAPEEASGESWPIFTTRPDTIYGVTFLVVSPQHKRLLELVSDEQREEVEKFLKKSNSVSEKDLEKLDKEGVFTGSHAINPLTDEKVPVYVGNFVLAEYGSGMVMAVPAHDKRDFDFAKKYGIEIKEVIRPELYENDSKGVIEAYVGRGQLINSGEFDGLDSEEAKEAITKYLAKKKKGRKTVNFKLRDWLVSRQRYWGTPIPIIHCESCGSVPVSEEDLPVKLPKKVEFGKGNPLESNESFVNVKCPKCGEKAARETDTMDTFVNSSWYFLRYCDSNNNDGIFDKKKVDYWMPMDFYVGGAEHACMHLIYSRFYTKFLRDLGLISFGEPAKRLFNQGMLHAADGNKMSKSLGNVINPMDVVEKYGADALRLALMSFASPDSDTNWDEKVLIGSSKFLNKVYDNFEKIKVGKSEAKIESKLNKIVKEVTNQIELMKYNLAIIKVRELFNSLGEEESKEVLWTSLKLLSVFCPHICEELWEAIGGEGFISLSSWPSVDEKKIDDKLDQQEEAIDKFISDLINVNKLVEGKTKAFVYVLPNEKENFVSNLDLIKARSGLEIEIYAVNDEDKYDPENKSKKVKPSRPGIYLE